jgi:hypothetical protein
VWGAKHGLAFSILLSGIVAIANGFTSVLEVRGVSFTLTRLVFSYLLGGALGGALMGAFRRIASTPFHKVSASVLVGTVAYFGVGLPIMGFNSDSVFAMVVAGGIMGLLAGLALFGGHGHRQRG